jgi:methionyl-tRNA formyltransferase
VRIVLLTGTQPQHRYVAREFVNAFGASLAAIIVADVPKRSLAADVRRYFRRYTLRQLASRFAARVYSRLTRREARREESYRQNLFPNGDGGRMPGESVLRTVPGHNSEACLSLLRELDPDVIAVYGTNVIREPVMRLARIAILNMHTGISPRYRGADCVFWPLHNGEPEWIGVTVHRLDAGLDSGAVLSIARPDIAPTDDEDSLFCKCVVVGTSEYVRVIRAIVTGAMRETPQNLSIGREYRFVDRTVAAERRVERLLRNGLLHRAATPMT